MTDKISTELSNLNYKQGDKEEMNNKFEEKSINTTVPDLDDVQSFCTEFHIKVENAAGIRPWLQFSDTNFSGNSKQRNQ